MLRVTRAAGNGGGGLCGLLSSWCHGRYLSSSSSSESSEIKFVLSLNCGSSSVKCKVTNPTTGEVAAECSAERLSTGKKEEEGRMTMKKVGEEKKEVRLEASKSSVAEAAREVCYRMREEIAPEMAGVGHRIVHGGSHFARSVLVDADVKAKIHQAAVFAPLHNEAALCGISAAEEAFPDAPQVAVFDTAFHLASVPERAWRYALPEELCSRFQIRKYGFHGTSHQYVFGEAARKLGKSEEAFAAVTAHLGNGCSLAAVRDGRCLDTTMGLTPLEGLMMGTRSGDVDPAVFKALGDGMGWGIDEVLDVLNKKSGFLGVAGTSDSREIEGRVDAGCDKAALALEMFCYRVAKSAASYLTVPLEGKADAMIFAGGIGEKSWMKRKRILEMLRPMGFQVDEERNRRHGKESGGVVTTADSSRAALVVKTDEELMIARETWDVINKAN